MCDVVVQHVALVRPTLLNSETKESGIHSFGATSARQLMYRLHTLKATGGLELSAMCEDEGGRHRSLVIGSVPLVG